MDLSPVEWRMILSRLRRARLLAGEDPHNPGHLDTHPLVREYYGNSGVNESRLGRNAIDGSTIIIEGSFPSCQIVSGTWSRFSYPLSAAAMPIYFVTPCMKFTFREFSGEMSTSLLISSGPEVPCFWC
jgi:hypothetical protein